jgi:aryl-alcohol dehydrogenase
VVKAGSKVQASPGDHVLLTYTCCGDCKFCKRGETSFCYDWEHDNFGIGRPDGSKSYSTTGGKEVTSHFFGQSSMAKYVVVSGRSMIKIDPSLPLDLLAPLGCGFMTGAGGKSIPNLNIPPDPETAELTRLQRC